MLLNENFGNYILNSAPPPPLQWCGVEQSTITEATK